MSKEYRQHGHHLHDVIFYALVLGYSIIRTLAPNAFGGILDLKFDRTTPELPCGLVTLPQMTLILLPDFSVGALYT